MSNSNGDKNIHIKNLLEAENIIHNNCLETSKSRKRTGSTLPNMKFIILMWMVSDSFHLPTIQKCAKHAAKTIFYHASACKFPHLQQLGLTIPPETDDKKQLITPYNNFKQRQGIQILKLCIGL